MRSAWCPGAVVVSGGSSSGPMLGGPARATWHSYEADPHQLSAVNGMKSIINAGNDLHLCLNPITGQYAQGLPANAGGKGLVNLPGGVETNREGSVNIQVEVIAFASDPFTRYITSAGLQSLHMITDWMASWGIPKVFPDGSPPPSPNGPFPRSVTNWLTKAGHYTHSDTPENQHTDPGAIDISMFFTSVPAPAPHPQSHLHGGPVFILDTRADVGAKDTDRGVFIVEHDGDHFVYAKSGGHALNLAAAGVPKLDYTWAQAKELLGTKFLVLPA